MYFLIALSGFMYLSKAHIILPIVGSTSFYHAPLNQTKVNVISHPEGGAIKWHVGIYAET